jgi:electron transfer flavoprotein beta subunit
MADVLVCIKRVPETSGQILLSDDAMSVDARHVGYTMSAHEECAVELAVRVAMATGGEVTVLSVGAPEAVEQIRSALALGCSAAALVEVDVEAFGPADVAAAIAEFVRTKAAGGTSYGLVLAGNDAADTGDFQVPIRLAYGLGIPVLTGISTLTVEEGTAVARGDGPAGTEVYRVPLPAVVAIMEGGVEPRYPSVPGRMKAKRTPVETVTSTVQPRGSGRVRLKLPPAPPSEVEVLGEGAAAAPAVVDLLERIGVLAS